MHVIIICCYGVITSKRSEIEIGGLREYFSGVAEYIEKQAKSLDAIVFSWWYTNQSFPSLSEAYSSYRFLQKNFIREFPDHISLLYEQNSVITWENIIFSLLLLRKYKPSTLTVVCDFVREEKVKRELQEILKNILIPYEVITFPRADNHENSTVEIQKLALARDLQNPHFHNMIQFLESTYVV